MTSPAKALRMRDPGCLVKSGLHQLLKCEYLKFLGTSPKNRRETVFNSTGIDVIILLYRSCQCRFSVGWPIDRAAPCALPSQPVPIASGHIRIAPRRLKYVAPLAGIATRWRISAYHADGSKT
jgi:hypothetical protein